MSEPSANAGDAEAVPAQEKDLDQQLQPQGQAVGSGGSPPEAAAEEVEVTTEQTEEAAEVPAPSGDAVPGTSGTVTDPARRETWLMRLAMRTRVARGPTM